LLLHAEDFFTGLNVSVSNL